MTILMNKFQWRKKLLKHLLSAVLLGMLLSGCSIPKGSVGVGDSITGEVYPNADQYKAGAFVYQADTISEIEVCWRSGKIEIIESDHPSLNVCESGGELDTLSTMYSMQDGGVLKIQFCASGAKIKVYPEEKHLRLEVPPGIKLSVHATAANVKTTELNQNHVQIAVFSGNMELGAVNASSVDLSSSAGTITADTVTAPEIRVNTSSGSVQLKRVLSDTVDAGSTAGCFDLEILSANSVAIHTKSGFTTLTLPTDGVQLLFDTQCGNFISEATLDQKGDSYISGNGKCKIFVESTSGNLMVCSS